MTIEIEGLDKLTKKLEKVEELHRVLRAPMKKSVSLLHDDISKYPRKDPTAFNRLATPKQKRAYWERVRSGAAEHRRGIGYVRTGKLGKKWTSEVRTSSTEIVGVVGVNAGYAPQVQSLANQTKYHKASGWPTIEKVSDDNEGKINLLFEQAIDRVVNE